MSSLELLQAIASALPPDAVEALIAVAERMMPAPEFTAYLAALPEEEIDEQTAVELTSARREAEGSPALSLDQIRQRFGR